MISKRESLLEQECPNRSGFSGTYWRPTGGHFIKAIKRFGKSQGCSQDFSATSNNFMLKKKTNLLALLDLAKKNFLAKIKADSKMLHFSKTQSLNDPPY